MRSLLALAALTIAACTTTRTAAPVQSWQRTATEADRTRLRDWRTALAEAFETGALVKP